MKIIHMDGLSKELKKFGRVQANVALSKLCTFGIGGPADYVLTTTETDELTHALSFLSGEGVDFLMLGGGSNVLFPDDGWRGVIIKNTSHAVHVAGKRISADAGVDLKNVVDAATRESLGGFEWAAGIPGTVGGAVRGNAGARYAFTGGEVKDSLTKAVAWHNGAVQEFSNSECAFSYRNSFFKQNPSTIVLSAEFELTSGNQGESLGMTQKIIIERRGKQAHYPSAGSFFKNVMLEQWQRAPEELPPRFLEYKKIAAGWLIEQAGCKGYTVGHAEISPIHANFIINRGGATAADVLAIVEHVTAKVYNAFGINLEPEVHIIK